MKTTTNTTTQNDITNATVRGYMVAYRIQSTETIRAYNRVHDAEANEGVDLLALLATPDAS